MCVNWIVWAGCYWIFWGVYHINPVGSFGYVPRFPNPGFASAVPDFSLPKTQIQPHPGPGLNYFTYLFHGRAATAYLYYISTIVSGVVHRVDNYTGALRRDQTNTV